MLADIVKELDIYILSLGNMVSTKPSTTMMGYYRRHGFVWVKETNTSIVLYITNTEEVDCWTCTVECWATPRDKATKFPRTNRCNCPYFLKFVPIKFPKGNIVPNGWGGKGGLNTEISFTEEEYNNDKEYIKSFIRKAFELRK